MLAHFVRKSFSVVVVKFICYCFLFPAKCLSFSQSHSKWIVTVNCVDWTSTLIEVALSTVRDSLVLMFGNSFVFEVVTVLFTSGVVSSGETR